MLVRLDRHGPVAVVTLDRPEKRNALSVALRRELAACFRALASDRDTCAMVLTGAGTAFCAGMDRSEFGGDADHRRDLFESSKELFASLGELPIPAIAAINGPALGGGSALAASCDIRLAAPATRLGHPEVALGIPASYAALLGMFPEQVARELAYTGRILTAEEALALGAVREVVADPVGRGVALGLEMARHGRAVRGSSSRPHAAVLPPAPGKRSSGSSVRRCSQGAEARAAVRTGRSVRRSARSARRMCGRGGAPRAAPRRRRRPLSGSPRRRSPDAARRARVRPASRASRCRSGAGSSDTAPARRAPSAAPGRCRCARPVP